MSRTLLVAIFVFLSVASQAQWLGSAPSISVNPKNPSNIVVSTSSNRTYYTLDGGANWQESSLTKEAIATHVNLSADIKGIFYAVYTTPQENSIVVQVSKNGGITWEETIAVSNSQDKTVKEPSISVDVKGNVYITWVSLIASADKSEVEILFSKSSGGKKWSVPASIYKASVDTADLLNTSFSPTTAISSDGKMYFVGWNNANTVFLDRSFNGGDIWLRHDITVNTISTKPEFPISIKPVITIDASKSNRQGMLFFLWTEQQSDKPGVYFVRSTNLGDHWTSPSKISDEAGFEYFIPNCTQDFTTAAMHASYYGYNQEERIARYYVATSTDGGNVFDVDPVGEFSMKSTDLVKLGNYVGISAAKGTVALAWTVINEDGSTLVHTSIKQRGEAKKK